MPITLFIYFFNLCKVEKGLWIIVIYAAVYHLTTHLYLTDFFVSHQALRLYYTLLTLFEFLSFSYFLRINIEDKVFSKVSLALVLSFSIFLPLYSIYAKFHKIDSLPIGVETIAILILSFYFFYEQMKNLSNLFIYNNYRFWIVLAFMLYLSGSFFIYIFADRIPGQELERYWVFTDIFYALKNILFFIAILVYVSQPNEKNRVKSNKHFIDIT